MWEFFEDVAYYHLWAVRRTGDSQELFHVQSREEAIALSATLNGYALSSAINFNKISRLTVVDDKGRAYEKFGVNVLPSVQDEERTLKLFISKINSHWGSTYIFRNHMNESKKFFVLLDWVGYEDVEVRGVYNTKEKALKAQESSYHPGNCEIQEVLYDE